MSKKRSRSQQIGMLAETEFQRFGLRAGLLPEKVRNDFGVDYLCQVVGSEERAGAATVGGAVIGAAIRGTDGRRPRIRLRREDAAQLLAADFPVCLVLVHAPSSADPQLFFRFVDDVMSDKLSTWLKRDADALIIHSRELLDWACFRGELARVIAPGFVERIRLRRVASKVTDLLPGSHLALHRTSTGDLTIVQIRDFFGQFAIDSSEEKQRVHAAAFGAASQFRERFAELRVKPTLIAALEGLPAQIAITAPAMPDTFKVSGRSGEAECRFERRHTSDHVGWVHASGFSITMSHAVQQDDGWVHVLRAQTDPLVVDELQDHPDLWQFLRMCVPEADLHFLGSNLVLKTDAIEFLSRYAYFARHLDTALRVSTWPKDTWRLSDAGELESLRTLGWLSALQGQVPTIEGWGLVVGDVTDDELEAEDAEFTIPVCANLPRAGLVTWVAVEGQRLVARGGMAGFRVFRIRSFDFDQRSQRFVKSECPEMVLHANLPTVCIPEMTTSRSDASSWGIAIGGKDGGNDAP